MDYNKLSNCKINEHKSYNPIIYKITWIIYTST